MNFDLDSVATVVCNCTTTTLVCVVVVININAALYDKHITISSPTKKQLVLHRIMPLYCTKLLSSTLQQLVQHFLLLPVCGAQHS